MTRPNKDTRDRIYTGQWTQTRASNRHIRLERLKRWRLKPEMPRSVKRLDTWFVPIQLPPISRPKLRRVHPMHNSIYFCLRDWKIYHDNGFKGNFESTALLHNHRYLRVDEREPSIKSKSLMWMVGTHVNFQYQNILGLTGQPLVSCPSERHSESPVADFRMPSGFFLHSVSVSSLLHC